MEIVNTILDFILIGTAVWVIAAAKGMGGILGKAFQFIVGGMACLGLAHLIETITFEILDWPIVTVEMVHRIIVLLGFVLVALGFNEVKKLRG